MRLRHIQTVSFSFSEETMYRDLVKELPHLANLRKDDVVLFRARTGNQLLFVYGYQKVDTNGDSEMCLRSERHRLPKHRPWSGDMVGNYANAVGITLDNVRLLEDHLVEQGKLVAEIKAKKKLAKKRAKKEARS